jgi:hemerythrin superfamily protein
MDIELLDQLETEHREVEQLLDQLTDAEDEETQAPLVEELVTKLANHMDVEETEVYPELAALDEEAAEEAETEHRLAREGITKLQELIGLPGFGAAVEMVRAGIAHHVEEEEGEVFPKLREASGVTTTSESEPSEEPSKADLYEEAQHADIPGRSSMTKEELADALDKS